MNKPGKAKLTGLLKQAKLLIGQRLRWLIWATELGTCVQVSFAVTSFRTRTMFVLLFIDKTPFAHSSKKRSLQHRR